MRNWPGEISRIPGRLLFVCAIRYLLSKCRKDLISVEPDGVAHPV